VFLGDENCFAYLHWLGEALTETGGQLHAYALMTNYVICWSLPIRASVVADRMPYMAKAFPTSKAVNDALHGLLALTEQTPRIPMRSTGRRVKRGGATR
jgi:hypothetical protein